jgi:hypothetical protein
MREEAPYEPVLDAHHGQHRFGSLEVKIGRYRLIVRDCSDGGVVKHFGSGHGPTAGRKRRRERDAVAQARRTHRTDGHGGGEESLIGSVELSADVADECGPVEVWEAAQSA